jgi:hypothetical protein
MGLFLRRPPKLVVRTLVATSSAIGLVLVAVFVVLSMDARNRIAGTAGESLDVAERAFADLDQHRQQETLIKLAALAENRALGDALARYRPLPGSLDPIEREMDRLAGKLGVDALVLTGGRPYPDQRGPAVRRVAPDQPMQDARRLGAAPAEEFIRGRLPCSARPASASRREPGDRVRLRGDGARRYLRAAAHVAGAPPVDRAPGRRARQPRCQRRAQRAARRRLPVDGTIDLADEPCADAAASADRGRYRSTASGRSASPRIARRATPCRSLSIVAASAPWRSGAGQPLAQRARIG